MKRSFLFAPHTAQVAFTVRKDLARVSAWLKEHREVRILVAGFCDPLGSEKCTHDLATRRAAWVGRFLIKRGLDAAQIQAMAGWEKAEPACGLPTESCKGMNRRARIFVSNPAAEKGAN